MILSKCRASRGGHADVLGAEHRVAAVEDTQHDRFAVDHRNDRDADVDLAPAILSLMRPSCGRRFSAMSRCERILMRETIAAWIAADRAGHIGLLQHAVDAVAQAKLVLERLDVHVGGAASRSLRSGSG